MTVQLEQIADATVRQDGSGVQVVRRARLTGITGPAGLRQRAALEATGLPRYGDRHPAWPELRVVDVALSPIDVAQWDAAITYRVPDANELAHMESTGTVIDRTWFAVTVSEELVTDINGERLYHWYKGNPLQPSILAGGIGGIRWSRATTQLLWKNEAAEVQRPSIGVRVTVSESSSIEDRLSFSGSINGAYWSGYAPKTWLIGGMESRWDRDRWLNTYELFYKADTWRFESRVEYFGAPPDDATVGNGIAFFDVYPQENFNRLPFGLGR